MPQQQVTREMFEEAGRELEAAQTADDVRRVMKRHYHALGYRRLCKLFIFEYGVDELWLVEVERVKRGGQQEG